MVGDVAFSGDWDRDDEIDAANVFNGEVGRPTMRWLTVSRLVSSLAIGSSDQFSLTTPHLLLMGSSFEREEVTARGTCGG